MDKKIILGATNKVAAIFSQYANNFAVRRNILPFVKWCHKKQPAGDNAKGESMYHLSQCLRYISSMLKETDKKQSDDFQELYKKSCENPEQLKLISVYDALIRSSLTAQSYSPLSLMCSLLREHTGTYSPLQNVFASLRFRLSDVHTF